MPVSDEEIFEPPAKAPGTVQDKPDIDTSSSHTADHESDMYESTVALAAPSSSGDERPPAKRIFLLEPAVALAYFAMNLSGTVFQNQMLYQTCTAIFGYSVEECKPYLNMSRNGSSEEIDSLVQPYVSTLLMARSLIESIIPTIILLFVGSWSDKFGRRPVLFHSFLGYLCYFGNMCGLSILSMKKDVSLWFFVVNSFGPAISGGTGLMITIVCCNISDLCHGHSVAIRMYFNQIAMALGIIVGHLASSYLLEATNMAAVYGVSMAAMLLAIIYIYFFFQESLTPQAGSLWFKIRALFNFNLPATMVVTCCKQRREYARAFLWMTVTALFLASFASSGESTVLYLFVRRKLNWTLFDFTAYSAITSGLQIIGGILGIIVLLKMLKVSIVTLALIAFGCCVVQSIVRAAAAFGWEMYLASGLGLFSGMATAMLYALLSYLGMATEMGKIYALTNMLSILAPLVSAPVYSSVYTSSYLLYPGLFNIISGLLYMLCFGLMSTIFGIRITHNYQFH